MRAPHASSALRQTLTVIVIGSPVVGQNLAPGASAVPHFGQYLGLALLEVDDTRAVGGGAAFAATLFLQKE